jgi:hypothetical protein
MSETASIGKRAFVECRNLRSIIIPAAIKSLPMACFCSCGSLEDVSFPGGSQLLTIGAAACSFCALRSITLPASLEIIGTCSFKGCWRLGAVTFSADSKLARIEAGAFELCTFLASFLVPPLVEFVGESCFMECTALCTFTFAPGCHLRQLWDLPPAWPGLHAIPDSVEDLAFKQNYHRTRPHALVFGDESRLVTVRADSMSGGPRRSFLRVSSRSLKIFRADLEFGSDEL